MICSIVVLLTGACAGTQPRTGPESLSVTQQREIGEKMLVAGDAAQAIRYLTLVEQRQPKDHVVQYDLALACSAVGLKDKALQHLKQAVALKPDYSEAHNAMGAVYTDQSRFVEAQDAFQRALSNPLYKTPYYVLYNMGQLYEKRSDPIAALIKYQEAVSASPSYAQAHYRMGVLLEGSNRREEARNAFGKATQHSPDMVEAQFCYGRLSHEAGNTDVALAAFNRVVRLDPHSSMATTAKKFIEEIQSQSRARQSSSLRRQSGHHVAPRDIHQLQNEIQHRIRAQDQDQDRIVGIDSPRELDRGSAKKKAGQSAAAVAGATSERDAPEPVSRAQPNQPPSDTDVKETAKTKAAEKVPQESSKPESTAPVQTQRQERAGAGPQDTVRPQGVTQQEQGKAQGQTNPPGLPQVPTSVPLQAQSPEPVGTASGERTLGTGLVPSSLQPAGASASPGPGTAGEQPTPVEQPKTSPPPQSLPATRDTTHTSGAAASESPAAQAAPVASAHASPAPAATSTAPAGENAPASSGLPEHPASNPAEQPLEQVASAGAQAAETRSVAHGAQKDAPSLSAPPPDQGETTDNSNPAASVTKAQPVPEPQEAAVARKPAESHAGTPAEKPALDGSTDAIKNTPGQEQGNDASTSEPAATHSGKGDSGQLFTQKLGVQSKTKTSDPAAQKESEGDSADSSQWRYVVQVSSFRSHGNAERMRGRLKEKGYSATVKQRSHATYGHIYLVLLEPVGNPDKAREILKQLEGMSGAEEPLVIRVRAKGN